MESPALLTATLDIERHVAGSGWDQPALLFALVPTEVVVAEQPELAEQLDVAGGGGPELLTFEQPAPPDDEDLDVFLARIEWPEQIVGAALVIERLVLPPEAEAAIADQPDATTAAREHPDARDMRIVAAVTRGGQRMTVLRIRATAPANGDDPADRSGGSAAEDEVLTGPDLVPGLSDALLATFG